MDRIPILLQRSLVSCTTLGQNVSYHINFLIKYEKYKGSVTYRFFPRLALYGVTILIYPFIALSVIFKFWTKINKILFCFNLSITSINIFQLQPTSYVLLIWRHFEKQHILLAESSIGRTMVELTRLIK